MKYAILSLTTTALLMTGCNKVATTDANADKNTSTAPVTKPATEKEVATAKPAIAPVKPAPPPQPAVEIKTVEELHKALKRVNPSYQNTAEVNPQLTAMSLSNTFVSDLTPIASMKLMMLDLRGLRINSLEPLVGMPLQELYLEETQVSDLLPLKGLQLKKLYLSKSNVTDLSPLAGMPLTELNLLGTQIVDIAPLRDMPLTSLWLTECPVSDITALGSCPLVSLTLHRTRVKDLSPLKTVTTLQRLHVGETAVTDLSPLLELPLNRLTFTPAKITAGIDGLRKMGSLQGLATRFDDGERNTMPPAEFWEKFDAGKLK
ncbi:hypothetical protein BVY04_03045 [bacterium M21]|nr:hypothetical protein BVY04_03045 [bacterium M21]